MVATDARLEISAVAAGPDGIVIVENEPLTSNPVGVRLFRVDADGRLRTLPPLPEVRSSLAPEPVGLSDVDARSDGTLVAALGNRIFELSLASRKAIWG